MSANAIAAVTATLRLLLQTSLQQEVTTLPPDKAANAAQANRLNLFLYHMSLNAAWRNQVIPNKVKPGETGFPPLALNLFYMLTAYGDDQTDEADHRLLGAGMRVLHDKGALEAQDIHAATDAVSELSKARLFEQFERVKITPEFMTLEEMSKLWTTFQTQYRISAAYQLSVVLIESSKPVKTPLPVLKRGDQDRGPDVVPTMPGVLEGVEYRDLRQRLPAFPAAQLGDIITLQGRNLPGTRCNVLFINPNLDTSAAEPDANVVGKVTPEAGSSETTIYVRLDPALPDWNAGPLQVRLEELPEMGKRLARSNALRFGLAPSLVQDNEMFHSISVEANQRQLVLRCQPGISQRADGTWPDVSLILSPLRGGGVVPPKPLNQSSLSLTPTTPVFRVEDVPPGRYRVRLRIESVESLVMKRDGEILDFDERQVVQL